MNNDLIRRQDAIDALEEHLDYLRMLDKNENPTAEGKWYGVNWARNTIADLPSAEERPQGEWKHHEEAREAWKHHEEVREAWKKLYSEIDKDNWLFVGTINPEMVALAIKALEFIEENYPNSFIDYLNGVQM